MPYGTIKIDTITFTSGSSDVSIPVSGLVQNPTFTGNVTVTGTVTASNVVGTTLISGSTVTGTTANFTSGNFSNISGGTHTITSGVFALGTAANPSISFTSDPNTGIYSLGADQVAISTNGTGRLFVNSSGNIGINNASPGAQLHLIGSSANNYIRIDNSSGSRLFLGGESGENVVYAQDGSQNAIPLVFKLGITERMRLDSSGRLGLGTSSPTQILTILSPTYGAPATSGSTQTNGAFRIRASGTTGILDFGIGAGGTNQWIQSTDSGALNSAYPLLINPNGGNVGIGTTAPTNALTIRASADDGIALTRPSNPATTHLLISTTEGGGDAYSVKYETSNNNQIFSTSTGGGTGGNIIFRTSTSAPSVERGRWDNAGRFLVGTSTARSNFLNSTVDAQAQIERAGEGTGELSLVRNANSTSGPLLLLGKSRGTTVGSNTIVSSGDQLGWISFGGSDGTEFVQGATIIAEVDGTPGANDMPGRLVFSTTADGASSPTERVRINQPYSGTLKGILEVTRAYTDNSTTSTGWGIKVLPNTGVDSPADSGAFYYDSSSGVANYTTHYGIYIKNTGAGTGEARYGGYFEVTSGSSNVSTYGVYAKANTVGNEGLYGTIYAVRGEATSANTGTTGYVVGGYFSANNWANSRCLELSDAYSTSATKTLVTITRNSSTVGTITTTLSATAYNTSSDYRLKENVVPLTGAIDRLKQLPVHRFNFIVEPDKTVDGFIAHEAQAVVPECVTGTKDEVDAEDNPVYQGIDQSKLVPLLTAALQEALQKIEDLEGRLTAAGI